MREGTRVNGQSPPPRTRSRLRVMRGGTLLLLCVLLTSASSSSTNTVTQSEHSSTTASNSKATTEAHDSTKAVSAAKTTTSTESSVVNTAVIEHESQLPLEFIAHIHPYAWEHRRPDPYFLPHHNAYNIASQKELSTFLEVQTHLKAHSREASKLKRVSSSYPGWAPADSKDELDPKGFSAKMGIPPPKNPASYKLENEDYIASDFKMDPEMVRGSNRYRRAVYGLRRRRMPYYGTTAPFGSTNPFHRQNAFFGAPSDFFAAKPPNPLLAIHNPHVADFGRLRGQETLLPYGGYSSFTPGHFGGGHTRGGYSGAYGVHDGINNLHASPYGSWSGGAGRFGGGHFGAVPSFIPGDNTFFNFYDGLFGSPGGGESGSSG